MQMFISIVKRRHIVVVAVSLSLLGCSSRSTGASDERVSIDSSVFEAFRDADADQSLSKLQSLYRRSVSVDYDPYYSLASMAEASDVIVRGRIVGVRDGVKVFRANPDPDDPAGHWPWEVRLALDVEIERVLGGRAPEILSEPFEIAVEAPSFPPPGGGFRQWPSASEYAKMLSVPRTTILFLGNSKIPYPSIRVENQKPGVVYLGPGLQGFLVEENGSVEVVTGEPLPGGPKASLAEVEAELSATAGGR